MIYLTKEIFDAVEEIKNLDYYKRRNFLNKKGTDKTFNFNFHRLKYSLLEIEPEKVTIVTINQLSKDFGIILSGSGDNFYPALDSRVKIWLNNKQFVNPVYDSGMRHYLHPDYSFSLYKGKEPIEEIEDTISSTPKEGDNLISRDIRTIKFLAVQEYLYSISIENCDPESWIGVDVSGIVIDDTKTLGKAYFYINLSEILPQLPKDYRNELLVELFATDSIDYGYYY